MSQNIDGLEVLQQCPLAILVLDAEFKVIFINQKTQALFGSDAILGKTQQQLQEQGMGWLFTDDAIQSATVEDGRQLWFRSTCKATGNNCTAWYLQDVTKFKQLEMERDKLHTELMEQNGTDVLTGLLNRRALLQMLEPQVSRSRRYHNPLSVVLMLVKPFLSEAGKAESLSESSVLAISQLLKDQMRWADQIGRLSVNEFVLVLPETHFEDAKKLTEKLAKSIERLNQESAQSSGKIQVIFGISEWTKGDDSKRLIERSREHIQAQI